MFEVASIPLIIAGALVACGIGTVIGFFIGRSFTLQNEPQRLKKDRERTLEALVGLMESTEQLNQEVDVHNVALTSAKTDLSEIDLDHEQGRNIQSDLMQHISTVVEANRQLENDLTKSRFDLQRQAQELDISRREARTDALCRVGNRKAFDETLAYRMKMFQDKSENFGLMLIDVDHFKRINDTFGHQSGDEVLISIGAALKQCVRPEDFVARLGGDEFAIILHGLDAENANLVGNRIRGTIELYDFSVGDEKGSSTVVTLSMGLAVATISDSLEQLYDRADKALYKSKDLGRNRLQTIVGDDTGGTTTPVVTGKIPNAGSSSQNASV